MKFAIINDTHVGPLTAGYKNGVQRKLMNEAERLVTEFVVKMNNFEKPEFVVNLGDSIEDVNDKEIDVKSFKKIVTLLSSLKMPIYYLIGNHDIRTLKEKDIAAMVGYESMNYSFNRGKYHFIALSVEMTENHASDLSAISAKVPEWQLKWLKDDLLKTDLPVVVFIHYGVAEDDLKGNFWFELEPHHALLENRDVLRTIFEKSGKVKAVFSAHQHWNKMHIHQNIPYFVVTSMAENTNNDGIPSGAHAIVTLDKEKVEVNVKGNDPAVFEYNFR